MKQASILILVVMMAGLSGGGCASAWQDNYRPNPQAKAMQLGPVEQVSVREVSPEVMATIAPSADRAGPTTLPAERGGKGNVYVLGRSALKATRRPDPDSLIRLARRVGADTVLVATTPAGQVTVTEQTPVQNLSGAAPLRMRRTADGGYTMSDRSVAWKPVKVTKDVYAYEAVFIRQAASSDARSAAGAVR